MKSHGHAGLRRTPTYRAWAAAKNRCTNPKNDAYESYGGRGIGFCKRWVKFENFLTDMGERPPGATLERKVNSKGYSPANCRWATRKDQARNRRSSHFVTINGMRRTVIEWCEINNLKHSTVLMRINSYGWLPWRAVTVPTREKLCGASSCHA